MITTYILSFFTGYLGILMGFRLALDRVQIARRRVASLHKDKILQVVSIRELAKSARVSKHKLKDSELLVEKLEVEAKALGERVGSVKRADNRLVVLDERRLPEDLPWILAISGPGGLLPEAKGDEGHENWTGHMRFLVWATTQQRAMRKATTRYPQSRGFKVELIDEKDQNGPSQAA
jgi:hypothetical protein